MNVSSGRRELLLAAGGFALALALRTVFFLSSRETWDFQSWEIAASIVEKGGVVYQETTRYAYSPVWAYVLAFLRFATKPLGLTLSQAVSLLLLAGDGATALLLFRIAKQRGQASSRALGTALLFFLNPVSVLVSSSLGMFDNLSIFFLLIAVFLSAQRPVPKKAFLASMSASLLVKHITWFHPLLLARRKEEPRVGLPAVFFPYAVFVASFLPFWRSWRGIREYVFWYRGLEEPYGTEFLYSVPGVPSWAPKALLLLAALSAAYVLRRAEFGRACLLLFLVVLIFAPGIVQYYFVWPIALGALYPSAGYAVYTAMVGAFLIHSPDLLAQEIAHLPGWSGPWWALVFWLLWEIRRQSRLEGRELRVRT
ncbi:MAG: hypothetical protein ACRD1P_10990 [Thermoanaerobaculia bacterium]